MKTVVVRNIPRADAKACEVFAKRGVSTVHEAYGRIGLMKSYMRPIWSGATSSTRATGWCPVAGLCVARRPSPQPWTGADLRTATSFPL